MIRLLTIAILLPLSFSALAEDWPTYAHDNRRSQTTAETLTLPLAQAWVYESPNLPQTAWTGPAKWDAYAGNDGLQSMRNFDPAFFVTAVDGEVFFGSSATDAAHCLDAATGAEKWVAFTDSAVRLPPTIATGRAYFGSDDGSAYCVDAASGEILWKFNPAPDAKRIPSNNKLVSPWPIRTGILVEGDHAYFAASLFPWEKSYLCAVDATSGEKLFVAEEQNLTLQGALLTSSEKLYAPQGRASPIVFARDSGSRIGSVPGTGGVFCILTEDEQLIAMPQNQKSGDNVTKIADIPGTDSNAVLSITGTERLIVAGKKAYFHQGKQLVAIDRHRAAEAQTALSRIPSKIKALKKQNTPEAAEEIVRLQAEIPRWSEQAKTSELWKEKHPVPSSLIVAGPHIIIGGKDLVTIIDAATGRQLWAAPVKGRVYGLVAANGRLFASTDHGNIHTFATAP
ncbi:MAG: outer membrane protein assembly factor BamB [Verrucomicrobiales bacterium]|jgi:outer membrane protein assembly factor BamB